MTVFDSDLWQLKQAVDSVAAWQKGHGGLLRHMVGKVDFRRATVWDMFGVSDFTAKTNMFQRFSSSLHSWVECRIYWRFRILAGIVFCHGACFMCITTAWRLCLPVFTAATENIRPKVLLPFIRSDVCHLKVQHRHLRTIRLPQFQTSSPSPPSTRRSRPFPDMQLHVPPTRGVVHKPSPRQGGRIGAACTKKTHDRPGLQPDGRENAAARACHPVLFAGVTQTLGQAGFRGPEEQT